MKFYIATGLANYEAHQELRDQLVALGHEITYNWTEHGSVQKESDAVKEQTAINEWLGVSDADVLIVLLPGGRGTHAEIGIALGTETKVVLVGSEEAQLQNGLTCVFYYHPYVTRVANTGEAFKVIQSIDWP